MKTIKTSELTGKALDWAVAKAEGATNLKFGTIGTWWFTDSRGDDRALSSGWSRAQSWHPSTNWEQAGPIIEREHIRLQPTITAGGYRAPDTVDAVMAMIELPNGATVYRPDAVVTEYGPAPLIAAMRCYVASKLGGVVEVPNALLDTDEKTVSNHS